MTFSVARRHCAVVQLHNDLSKNQSLEPITELVQWTNVRTLNCTSFMKLVPAPGSSLCVCTRNRHSRDLHVSNQLIILFFTSAQKVTWECFESASMKRGDLRGHRTVKRISHVLLKVFHTWVIAQWLIPTHVCWIQKYTGIRDCYGILSYARPFLCKSFNGTIRHQRIKPNILSHRLVGKEYLIFCNKSCSILSKMYMFLSPYTVHFGSRITGLPSIIPVNCCNTQMLHSDITGSVVVVQIIGLQDH